MQEASETDSEPTLTEAEEDSPHSPVVFIIHQRQAYQIIVADAADAVSVNFSGRCKFFSDLTRKIGNLLCILP